MFTFAIFLILFCSFVETVNAIIKMRLHNSTACLQNRNSPKHCIPSSKSRYCASKLANSTKMKIHASCTSQNVQMFFSL